MSRDEQRPPAGEPGVADVAAQNANRRQATPLSGECRVRWRQDKWSPTTSTKSRVFQRHSAAVRFVRRLDADEVWIERRDVGRWEPIDAEAWR